VLNNLFLLLLGFAIGLSGALIPGPLLVYTISLALKQGVKAGIMVIWGHFFVEIIVIFLILSGGGLLLNSPLAARYLPWIGGAALILMGLLVFKKSFHISLPQESKISIKKYALVGGVFFTALNHGFPIWWASIGTPVVLKIYLTGLIGVIFFMIGHWCADFGWYAFISYSISRGKSYLSESNYRILSRILGLVLVGFGVFFLIN